MTPIRFAPGAQTLRGTVPGADAIVSVVETPSGGSAGSGPVTNKDVNTTVTTTTSATNNFRIDVTTGSSLDVAGGGAVAFVSATPATATVDAQGNVSHVSDGPALISVVAAPSVRGVRRDMLGSSTVVVTTWDSWVSGSLAKHVEDAIVAMIGVNSPGAATQAVLTSSSGGASAPNHIRNAGIFTGALDLTAISVYGTAQNCNRYPVVLISPRHIMAGHVGCVPGQQVVFKDSAGNYQVRTVLSPQAKISPDMGDNYVGLLDSAINTITPMKVLPATWASYIPSEAVSMGVAHFPVLYKGYTYGDWIRPIGWWGTTPATAPVGMYVSVHNRAPFTAWSGVGPAGGDSNGPVFIPVNGAPVLLHCLNYAYGGSFYAAQAAAIQSAMNTLLTGHTLGVADLSAFTLY